MGLAFETVVISKVAEAWIGELWSHDELAHVVVEDLAGPAPRSMQKRSDGNESGSPDAWSV
jgi:hypothetical protein